MNKNSSDGHAGRSAPREGECNIFETTAQLLDAQHASSSAREQVPVIAAVRDLLRALSTGNAAHVEESLHRLGGKRDSELFARVGQMTRALHNSLSDFRASLDVNSVTLTTTNIPDAASKLEAVINVTFEAANRTLSLCESTEHLLHAAEARRRELDRMLHSDAHAADIKEAVTAYLKQEEDYLREARRVNSEVLIAQGFQDLTGQALRKVIKLVTELEGSLVSLIKIFGHPTTLVPAPQAPSGSGDVSGNKMAQDDVDGLLSSLGF